MHKLMKMFSASVCAASFFGFAIAAETVPTSTPEVSSEEAEALEKDDPKLFEAGFDLDFFSAYIWRNSVQNDEPAIQPCVWADLTYFEPFWLGFSIWQNYDLTRRRKASLDGGLTETDFNVHLAATAWASEDERTSLDVEIGHEWYVNHRVKSEACEYYKNSAELYAKITLNNEIANIYGMASWMYDDFGEYKQGMNYEIGINREFDILSPFELPEDKLIFGLDWNVNFGDARYLYYLYGGVDYWYDEESGEEGCSNPKAGIAGTTLKAYLTWNITEWMSLVGTIAYTGVLNGSARQALGDEDTGWQGDAYRRDLLWGGVSLKFEF